MRKASFTGGGKNFRPVCAKGDVNSDWTDEMTANEIAIKHMDAKPSHEVAVVQRQGARMRLLGIKRTTRVRRRMTKGSRRSSRVR